MPGSWQLVPELATVWTKQLPGPENSFQDLTTFWDPRSGNFWAPTVTTSRDQKMLPGSISCQDLAAVVPQNWPLLNPKVARSGTPTSCQVLAAFLRAWRFGCEEAKIGGSRDKCEETWQPFLAPNLATVGRQSWQVQKKTCPETWQLF